MIHETFLEELILDLTIKAERDSKRPDYAAQYAYSKKHHPGPWRPNSLEPREPYICPKCHYFHAAAYIKGQKPKRCYRCRTPFDFSKNNKSPQETV